MNYKNTIVLIFCLFCFGCTKTEIQPKKEVVTETHRFLVIQNVCTDCFFEDAWLINGKQGEDTVLNIYRELLYVNSAEIELVGNPSFVRIRFQEGEGQRERLIQITNTYTYFDFKLLDF